MRGFLAYLVIVVFLIAFCIYVETHSSMIKALAVGTMALCLASPIIAVIIANIL